MTLARSTLLAMAAGNLSTIDLAPSSPYIMPTLPKLTLPPASPAHVASAAPFSAEMAARVLLSLTLPSLGHSTPCRQCSWPRQSKPHPRDWDAPPQLAVRVAKLNEQPNIEDEGKEVIFSMLSLLKFRK
jgi:hypothetical protein